MGAAGIFEYKNYTCTDQIVQQIVNWGFGYFNKKQAWETYIDVIEEYELPRKALPIDWVAQECKAMPEVLSCT